MRRINEIFYSLQGEGYHVGTPAIFIRFAGCNLHCSFCDTDHESHYIPMSDDEIVARVADYPAQMVVLTGGEPALSIDDAFIDRLHATGRYIAIETNGTVPLPANIDWVTCSPKLTPADIALSHIDELKLIYQGVDVDDFLAIPARHYYLQPCSGLNTTETIDYILSHPRWRLSLQTHKLVGIR